MVRGQWIRWMRLNTIAQFVQLLKCGCAMCAQVLSWRRIGPFLLTNDSCRVLQFSVHLINLQSILPRCNGFARIQKAAVGQTTKQWPWHFWCKFCFGKWFGASSWSNHWAGHCWWSYKIHFSSHVTIWSRNGLLLLHRIRKDDTSKWFFSVVVTVWDTHLSSFLTFPIYFSCQTTVEWLMLSSAATSHSFKRINFSDPLNGPLSTSNGWPLCCWSSTSSSSLQNFLKHHWTVCLLAVSGPNVLLILWVVSTALWAILNSNKKITRICFLSNIISIV